jgi:hypothetical protein
LSNCESKIIAKESKVLDDLTDPNQSSHVNGRSVTDSLQSFLFMEDHCIEEEVDAALISLNTKKVFDSLSHQYSETILKNNGFGFKTLYSKISAKILINGHLIDRINIRKGYKQVSLELCFLHPGN